MKRYKFQALVTLDQPATGVGVQSGQTRRMVVRGEHHETHGSQLFTALVTPTGGDLPRPDDDHVIMTIALSGADPSEYFEVGDHFALWLGGDVGHGVVTRRLFV